MIWSKLRHIAKTHFPSNWDAPNSQWLRLFVVPIGDSCGCFESSCTWKARDLIIIHPQVDLKLSKSNGDSTLESCMHSSDIKIHIWGSRDSLALSNRTESRSRNQFGLPNTPCIDATSSKLN